MQRKLFNNIPLDNPSGNSVNARRSRSFPLFGGQARYSFAQNYDRLSEELVNRYLEVIDSSANKDDSVYFGQVDMQYGGISDSDQVPPDYNSDNYALEENFETTASSPWVPNTTSPESDGQRLQSKKPDRYLFNNRQALIYGPGLGTSLSPKKSSETISKLNFTNLQKGSSEPGIQQIRANVDPPNFNNR